MKKSRKPETPLSLIPDHESLDGLKDNWFSTHDTWNKRIALQFLSSIWSIGIKFFQSASESTNSTLNTKWNRFTKEIGSDEWKEQEWIPNWMHLLGALANTFFSFLLLLLKQMKSPLSSHLVLIECHSLRNLVFTLSLLLELSYDCLFQGDKEKRNSLQVTLPHRLTLIHFFPSVWWRKKKKKKK